MPAVPQEAYDRLLSERRQLVTRLAEAEAECDQWQRKLTEDAWPEIKRLRQQRDDMSRLVEYHIRSQAKAEAETEQWKQVLQTTLAGNVLQEAHIERLLVALGEITQARSVDYAHHIARAALGQHTK